MYSLCPKVIVASECLNRNYLRYVRYVTEKISIKISVSWHQSFIEISFFFKLT